MLPLLPDWEDEDEIFYIVLDFVLFFYFLFHFYITDLTRHKQQKHRHIARSKFYIGSIIFVKETVCKELKS